MTTWAVNPFRAIDCNFLMPELLVNAYDGFSVRGV